MSKSRAPRPIRRTGTEVHADSRTQRKRQRGQEESEAIRTQLDWIYDDLETGDVEENKNLAEPVAIKGPVTSIELDE